MKNFVFSDNFHQMIYVIPTPFPPFPALSTPAASTPAPPPLPPPRPIYPRPRPLYSNPAPFTPVPCPPVHPRLNWNNVPVYKIQSWTLQKKMYSVH